MNKTEIRKTLLKKRKSQPEPQKKIKDAKIAAVLLKSAFLIDAKVIFTYLSHCGEVSTDGVIRKFFGKKKIVVPVFENDRLCIHELSSPTEFIKGRFSIREPHVRLPHKDFAAIDCALIPGVAFDQTGHRIGFGGGHFDRLLKKMRCTTIGLAYEFQIVDKVPARHYDVPVDWIVTEKRLIRCKNYQ